MTDEQTQAQDANVKPSGLQDESELEAQLNSPEVPQWVRDMISNVNARAAGYRAKLREAEEKSALSERAKLAEKEQYKELAASLQAELDKLRPQVDAAQAYRETIAATVEARIKAVPEQMRSLVPAFDDPAKTLQWLDANAAVLSTPRPPQMDAGVGGDGGGKTLPKLTPEQVELAKLAGMTPQQYAEWMTKPSVAPKDVTPNT